MLESAAPRYQLEAETLREALYADLPENHLLTALPDFTPDQLVDRYNLAQAQGLLYSALCLRLTAHRNVPGEYRRLFQHLKFHGLMYAVEGNLDDGYQIYVDGPASLFKQTRKYGLQMALFLPALLRVSRWEIEAVVQRDGQELSYRLDSQSPLKPLTAAPPTLRQPAGGELRPPLGKVGDAVDPGAGGGDCGFEGNRIRARLRPCAIPMAGWRMSKSWGSGTRIICVATGQAAPRRHAQSYRGGFRTPERRRRRFPGYSRSGAVLQGQAGTTSSVGRAGSLALSQRPHPRPSASLACVNSRASHGFCRCRVTSYQIGAGAGVQQVVVAGAQFIRQPIFQRPRSIPVFAGRYLIQGPVAGDGSSRTP